MLAEERKTLSEQYRAGYAEQLGREEDVVRVELPELLSGDGDLGDPQLERLHAPAQVSAEVSHEPRLHQASTGSPPM